MFNLSVWLKDNLITACRERSFTVAQINLMAYKYFSDAKITESDFNSVLSVSNEIQAEIDSKLAAEKEEKLTDGELSSQQVTPIPFVEATVKN